MTTRHRFETAQVRSASPIWRQSILTFKGNRAMCDEPSDESPRGGRRAEFLDSLFLDSRYLSDRALRNARALRKTEMKPRALSRQR